MRPLNGGGRDTFPLHACRGGRGGAQHLDSDGCGPERREEGQPRRGVGRGEGGGVDHAGHAEAKHEGEEAEEKELQQELTSAQQRAERSLEAERRVAAEDKALRLDIEDAAERQVAVKEKLLLIRRSCKELCKELRKDTCTIVEPPPCGVEKVLCRLMCMASTPRSPGRTRPTMALKFAPSQ